jgi:hypothetical protein
MPTATAPRSQKKRSPKKRSTTKKKVDPAEKIAKLEEQLRVYESRFAEIDVFIDFVRQQKEELIEKNRDLVEAKAVHDQAKDDVRELRDSIAGAKDSLFQVLEPGAFKALPLFDRMEPADKDVHGEHSAVWRQEPLSALRLSASANAVLIEAGLVLVGQLQDRILDRPGDWFEKIEGLTGPVAAAIADKLNDFIYDACRGGK